MSALDQRLHVRLPAGLRKQVRELADKEWLSETAAIRHLVTRGLESYSSEAAPQENPPAALAGLVACEQVLLLLQTIVPEGAHRAIQLAPEAVKQAEKRLHLVVGADPDSPIDEDGPEAA